MIYKILVPYLNLAMQKTIQSNRKLWVTFDDGNVSGDGGGGNDHDADS